MSSFRCADVGTAVHIPTRARCWAALRGRGTQVTVYDSECGAAARLPAVPQRVPRHNTQPSPAQHDGMCALAGWMDAVVLEDQFRAPRMDLPSPLWKADRAVNSVVQPSICIVARRSAQPRQHISGERRVNSYWVPGVQARSASFRKRSGLARPYLRCLQLLDAVHCASTGRSRLAG